jgi:hypothetical protein
MVMQYGHEIYTMAQAKEAGNCTALSCAVGTGTEDENTLFLTLSCKEDISFFTKVRLEDTEVTVPCIKIYTPLTHTALRQDLR